MKAKNVQEKAPIRLMNKLNLGIRVANIAVRITIMVLNAKLFNLGILFEVGIF
jgi:hypothetical protein